MTPTEQAARWLADCPRYRVHPKRPNVMFTTDDGRWINADDAITAIARHLAPGDDLVAQAAAALEGVMRLADARYAGDKTHLTIQDADTCAKTADTITALLARISALTATVAEVQREAGKMLAEQDHEYNRKTNDMIERHAKQTATLRARLARMEGAAESADAFNKADWFWRTMDPDDCGDSPEEAINRAMVGRFCVCEIASSYAGPTRYGFIAPVLDPERDDEEFVHFATQQEAIDAAKARAALTYGGSNG